MNVNQYISALAKYGIDRGLIDACDRTWAINQLIDALGLHSYEDAEPADAPLEDILRALLDDAVERGACESDVTSRDLLDTRLMGILTPPPREVRAKSAELYAKSPREATAWYYQFSQDTDYIRRYRIAKDMRWLANTEYGDLVITINLSKPEKDPKAIAAAKNAPQSGYPKCQLCAENEGYAGRMNHPPRQNHRIIPVTVAGSRWFLQYSPYVYYNEHCIVFNEQHTPMVIDRAAFAKLMDFVTEFPHYFVGSNADLPIVGGSILSHEHFQGGCFTFPMEVAPVEQEIRFTGYEDIRAGIVKWPLSVIRLTGADPERLADLAEKILNKWRGYTDEAAFIYAETEGVPHNTITPIARRSGEDYDSTLIVCDGEAMLIDGGPSSASQMVFSCIRQQVEELDVVIATHPHDDHIGGLSAALNAVPVGVIYSPISEWNSTCWANIEKYAEAQGTPIVVPMEGDAFALGSAIVTIIHCWPEAWEENDMSIVLRLDYGETSFLFTGDAEIMSEEMMLSDKIPLRADVLKVAHHGSRYSSSPEFLAAVKPEWAVISCGEGNVYRHPHEEALQALSQVTVLRTDQMGTIFFHSDGVALSVEAGMVTTVDVEYIGNRKSMKFHHRECESVMDMADKNKVPLLSRDDAIKMGFQPCGRCKP